MKFNRFFMVMAAAATVFAACEEQKPDGGDDFVEVAPEFTSDIEDIIVTEEMLSTEITFTYSAADFGVDTQINYAIEAQVGDGAKVVIATSTTTEAKATLEDINYELFTKLQLEAGVATDLNYYVSAQMGSSEKLYSQPKTAKFTAINAGPKKSEWGLVGTINGWGAPDVPMFEVDEYFVAYNVVLTETDEFKIRANEEWNDAKNYGTEVKGTFAANTIIPVITSGGSQNIGVKAAGTYDIYFIIDTADETTPGTVYLMEAGKTPDQAGEAEVTYVDPSSENFNVGLSGSALGWDDPAFETNDRAEFKTKNVTDEATYAGTYTFELASVAIVTGDTFKIRINGAWIGFGQAELSGISVSNVEEFDEEGNLKTGADFAAAEDGTFKVTISFDWDGLTYSNVTATFAK